MDIKAEVENALTQLTRLAQRRSEQEIWLHAALQGRHEALSETAVKVAIETGDPVGKVLAAQVQEAGSHELAERLLDLCELDENQESLPLRELALVATRKCWEQMLAKSPSPPSDEYVQLAHLTNRLASRLGDLGRREEALDASQRAVAMRRELAAVRSASVPDLAESLNNLGLDLGRLGFRDEAVEAIREALQIYRELVPRNPDACLPHLAACLNNLSNQQSDLGSLEEALESEIEAVGLYRRLAAENSSFLPDLAMGLANLGNRLSDLARHQASLSVTQEAVSLYRELAADRPDTFLPDLARSLHDLGGLRLYRKVASDPSSPYRADLAMSVNNLGADLSDLGRFEEALAAMDEAVALYRELSATRSDAFLADLAMSLTNRSEFLSPLPRHVEAFAAAAEALRHLVPFWQRNPGGYDGLMRSLRQDYRAAAKTSRRKVDRSLLAARKPRG